MIIERCEKYRCPFSFCKECKRVHPFSYGGCLYENGCKAAIRLYKKHTRKGKEVVSEEEGAKE